MDKWTKKDFEIKSYRSGSQLKGRENEWLCKIIWNGKTLKDGFSNKSEANKWLSDFIRKRNELVKMKISDSKKAEIVRVLDAGRINRNSMENTLAFLSKHCSRIADNIETGLDKEDSRWFKQAIVGINLAISQLEKIKDACEIYENDFR